MRLTSSDLYESSFFHSQGARLAEVWSDKSRESKVIFTFEGDNDLGELQKSYHRGTATVNLADYRHSLEALKDAMFRILRSENHDRRMRNERRNNQKVG